MVKLNTGLQKNQCDKSKIQVTGESTLKVNPNMAMVNIGIDTEDKDLQKAQQQNAKISRIVIKGLENMGIKKNDISTVIYNIEPLYDYVDGKQVFNTYSVSNVLNVNITDMNKIGLVIDESVKNGANNIKDITFTVSNPEVYYNKALQLAVKNSVEKAMIIGNVLNIKVNKIPCSIEERTIEFMNNSFNAAKLAGTDILPGSVKINAGVSSVFSY